MTTTDLANNMTSEGGVDGMITTQRHRPQPAVALAGTGVIDLTRQVIRGDSSSSSAGGVVGFATTASFRGDPCTGSIFVGS